MKKIKCEVARTPEERKQQQAAAIAVLKPLEKFGESMRTINESIVKPTQEILKAIRPPKVQAFIETSRMMNDFAEEYRKVEKNYFYVMALEEIEDKDKYIESLENDLKILLGLKQKYLPNKTNTINKLSLKSDLSISQIIYLYNKLSNVFICDLEQWQNLFSDNIVLSKPIKAAYIVDVTILFNTLLRYGFIKKITFASIIGSSKAFIIDDCVISRKQINDAKKDLEYIKANKILIENAVTSLLDIN